jgi:DNA (cytosine-5)-methyltransferase 1
LIGGPPCQGFSRANTSSDEKDPRNRLTGLYTRIVKELLASYPLEFIVFENVLGIRDKKHRKAYRALINGLRRLAFEVDEREMCALDYGVPQRRRRVIVAGLRANQGHSGISPIKAHGKLTVRDAIGGMADPFLFQRGADPSTFPVHPNHWTMQPKSKRFSTDLPAAGTARSFKCLSWDEPSPTIAFGHREILVHPDRKRRLSIYEAMLIQGFPSSFVLEGNLSQQVEQISNAVPPPMARSLAAAVKSAIVPERGE